MAQEILSQSDLYYLGLLPLEYYADCPSPEAYFEDGTLHISGFTGNIANHSSQCVSPVANMLSFEWAKDLSGNWLYPVVLDLL